MNIEEKALITLISGNGAEKGNENISVNVESIKQNVEGIVQQKYKESITNEVGIIKQKGKYETLENKDIKCQKFEGLSIMYLNARSIRNKIDELRAAVEEHSPDIIGVVETWLSDKFFDTEINIKEYSSIRIDRNSREKEKGGGIIVYIRNTISFVDNTEDYCENIDYVWVKVTGRNKEPINIGVFYRPPDSTLEQLNFLLKYLLKYKTMRTIILGDFNYGEIDWKGNNSGGSGKKFLDVLNENNIHQCIK